MTDSKLFVVCSGLGRINRGFETFSQEVYDILSKDSSFEVFLLKGSGSTSEREIAVRNIPRFSEFGKLLSKILKKEAYILEQFTFAFSSLPQLIKHRPQIVLYSDFYVGILYWYFRKWFGLKYKLLYSNGAPNGPPFTRCDLVQQLLPFYKEKALLAGEEEKKHYVLPYAVTVRPISEDKLLTKRAKAKELLGLNNTLVILCVAAINDSHKRISYLIEEVAQLTETDFRLIVLGQKNEESPAILEKGEKMLGNRFTAKTLSPSQLSDYYFAADLFVLPSLTEGLPRVMLEALSYGLPVLAHDYTVSREVLQEYGLFADFSVPGNLKKLILQNFDEILSSDLRIKRIKFVEDFYSWKSLKNRYINMFQQLLN